MFKPRPGQEEVLSYTAGRMGISAVPGSGKTHTLSCLAAQLVADPSMEEDQEVLIVTLVNSAVQNFSARIASFIKEKGLLPNFGYRVRTLHGLAHDIVRERPDLVGLSDQFSILEERESSAIMRSIVSNLLPARKDILKSYILDETDLEKYDIQKRWVETTENLCANGIRIAKDLQTSPQQLSDLIVSSGLEDPLIFLVRDVYQEYQKALCLRSSVDFDDLISLALKTLTLDPEYLKRLRRKWPYILEDEAQDSSRLQEDILNLLCGPNGNWVRVGDPNQAIFETFTTASPFYLRRFLASPGVARSDLSHSGRSTRSIIFLANELIRWTKNLPDQKMQESLDLPLIYPVPPGDPQPNPEDTPSGVFLKKEGLSPEEELNVVIRSIKNWLPDLGESTCAVLVPRNDRGEELADKLKTAHIPIFEMLRSSTTTRTVADILASVLRCLAEPNQPGRLAEVFEKRLSFGLEKSEPNPRSIKLISMLKKCSRCEDFLHPSPGKDWLASIGVDDDALVNLVSFREIINRWQLAASLPIDQFLLIIGQDLFTAPGDLALTHKLALSLERSAAQESLWQLPDFASELTKIASNQRKFLGFEEDDTGFDPARHKGEVVITTIHKAKGLEWDRVYLLSVNNYDFPFAQSYDSYISEKWFIRDHLNLEAETIAKITALVNRDSGRLFMPEGIASEESRIEYSSERLRLFFVGITRARRELCITWNTGRRGDAKQAIPFEAIRSAWEERDAPAA
jgi:DNA helicase-2/ATP-dependent DNA helicase PcrA